MTQFQERLSIVMAAVKVNLKDSRTLTEDQIRTLLARYTASVEGNFVAWMGAAAIYARSLEGQFAAKENLYVELRDNHPQMLRDFSIASTSEPEFKDYSSISQEVVRMRSFIASANGLQVLTVMAVLEATSELFIPYLEMLAMKRNSQNIIYTRIHGLFDKSHAQQFAWAIEHEAKHYEFADQFIDDGICEALSFLEGIFKIK